MREPSTPIAIPERLRWSCIGCGRSCEDWTEIAIEPDEADRLKRLPLFNPRLADAGDALPFGPSPRVSGQDLLRLRPQPDGAEACTLLDDDRRCAVHLAHGEAAKPSSCRAFPFVFIDTPDGARLALSFACSAVLHDLGEPLIGREDEVAAISAIAHHRERRGHGVLIAPGTPLAWPDYRVLESECAELLHTVRPVAAALLAQARLLRERAGLPPALNRPSPRLREHALALLLDRVGRPPRFRAPLAGLEPPEEDALTQRWLQHRLWRGDLLRGDDILFAHGLLLTELALARAWASTGVGLSEAIAQVERGLSLHSDMVQRLVANHTAHVLVARLFHSPGFAASLTGEPGRHSRRPASGMDWLISRPAKLRGNSSGGRA